MAEIRRNLDNEFAIRRDTALRMAERRKEEVNALIPEISAIDSEITMMGIRYARTLLSENGPAFGAQTLSERISELNSRKEALLKKHNLPKDYLEPQFSCKECEDRGYVTDPATGVTVPCACYRKLYLEQLYSCSNLSDDGETGFSKFDESYYPDSVDKKKYLIDVSPREQILFIRSHCMDFIEHISRRETSNLYFFGPTGTGKTFMAKSLGLELVKKGYSVLYLSATSLFSIIRQCRMNPESEGNNDPAYRNLITVNLLILDDLGTEPGSDARYAELLTLLELRKARDKNHTAKTIISSNLDLKRLSQEYNERIASRIVGEFNTLRFVGDDIRILKKIR